MRTDIYTSQPVPLVLLSVSGGFGWSFLSYYRSIYTDPASIPEGDVFIFWFKPISSWEQNYQHFFDLSVQVVSWVSDGGLNIYSPLWSWLSCCLLAYVIQGLASMYQPTVHRASGKVECIASVWCLYARTDLLTASLHTLLLLTHVARSMIWYFEIKVFLKPSVAPPEIKAPVFMGG